MPRFTGPTYLCPSCGRVAQILHLSIADLRRNGFALYREDAYVNWCGHAQPFVPLLVAEDVAELAPRRRDVGCAPDWPRALRAPPGALRLRPDVDDIYNWSLS